MANPATINATPEIKAVRNVERYKRLVNEVIPKRQKKGLETISYEEEAARLKGEIDSLKAALASVDG